VNDKYFRTNYIDLFNYINKRPTFALEMKIKNLHINLSLKQNSDRLEGFYPAKGYGCGMYFIELKCKL
jgi:hypothetical protein